VKTMPERMKLRMRKDRPMTAISIRIPEDVVDELKEVAPLLGFSGYQPLIRAYIGQGLRKDISRLPNSPVEMIAERSSAFAPSKDWHSDPLFDRCAKHSATVSFL
jgi:hypothetical protein